MVVQRNNFDQMASMPAKLKPVIHFSKSSWPCIPANLVSIPQNFLSLSPNRVCSSDFMLDFKSLRSDFISDLNALKSDLTSLRSDFISDLNALKSDLKSLSSDFISDL